MGYESLTDVKGGFMAILKKKISKIIFYIVIVVMAFVFLFPLLVMITTSFKTYKEAFDVKVGILPHALYLGNYIDVFKTIPFLRYLGTTLWIIGMNALGTVIVTPIFFIESALDGKKYYIHNDYGDNDDSVYCYYDSFI